MLILLDEGGTKISGLVDSSFFFLGGGQYPMACHATLVRPSYLLGKQHYQGLSSTE